MNLEERLMVDLKKAMKDGNSIDKNTIQFMRAQVLKLRKDKQTELTEQEVEGIILQERKKRYEALAMFEKGNRKDLMENTMKELACINRYLPQPMTEQEIEEGLKEIIAELGADKSMFGKVMGTAKAKFGSKADGKLLSEVLKRLLEN